MKTLILIRVLGLLGVAATVVGFQCKQHKYVIGLRTANELLFALQYFLLGGYTGALMNMIGSVRNLIFIEQVKRHKNRLPTQIAFSLFFIIAAVFTWSGFPSAVFAVGKVITTFNYGCQSTKQIRLVTILTSIMWIVYNASVGSYEAIVSDGAAILSAIVGLIRLDLPQKKPSHRQKKPKEPVAADRA